MIGKELYNSLTEAPFSNCGVCDQDLLDNDLPYLIEKAYKQVPPNNGKQLLFEIAVCTDCASRMRESLSDESLVAVDAFFQEALKQRQEELLLLTQDDLSEICLLSGEGLNTMEEYQVYAHCRGLSLAPEGGKYILSGKIIEEIQSLLSTETKDVLRDFSDQYLGTPPEFSQLFKNGPLIGI